MDPDVYAWEQRQRRIRFIAEHGVWIGMAIGAALGVGAIYIALKIGGVL